MTRMTRRRSSLLAVSLSACLVMGGPGEALGQTVRLVPQAGLYLPVNDYGEIREGVDGAVELGRKSATLALGLAGELAPPALPFGLRVTVMHGTASPVPYAAEGDCLSCRTRGSLLVATGAVVLRPIPRLVGAEPYVLAGGGVRRFAFEAEETPEEGIFRDQSRGAAHLGGGVDVSLGSLSAVLEVGSVVGGFEPGGGGVGRSDGVPTGERRTVTDVFVTLGLSLSI